MRDALSALGFMELLISSLVAGVVIVALLAAWALTSGATRR